jgi:NADH dehydrogenase
MPRDIVIAGGGFGGFYAARTLERVLPATGARITIVSDVNFLLYTPLLPGAAAGTLEPRHVVVPLREELDRTELRLGTVTSADPESSTLRYTTPEGDARELGYDHLVVALGSVPRTLPVPGLAEHAVGFATLPQAIALRNRVISMLEAAESATDPAVRDELLSFVFVGAGYAGVEGIAELQHFAADLLALYPRCRLHGMRWTLVEARGRIMPEISASLARFTTRELSRRGIVTRVHSTVAEVGPAHVRISDGEVVPARTVVWTAGVTPHPACAQLGLPLDHDRIAVDRQLRVPGYPGVWALGDAAAVPDPARRGRPCPPTAQHAIRQGRTVARNIAADLGTGRARPFRYRTKGVFVDLGRHRAVASTMGLRWRGFPAWFLARTYHLAMMPGTRRKVRLMADWTVGLLFGRAAAELGQLGHPSPLGAGAIETPREDERSAHVSLSGR